MYTDFYRLSTTPFRLTPDPKFFFASSGHSRGLAYLRYGLQQGQGFVVITGVPGTGKSMLIQALLAELSSQRVTVATIANTNLEADDVLRAVADAFGVRVSGSSKADYISTLERFFRQQAQQGKHVLLVVDEAQNLPRRSLEELRMLSNFQEENRLLVQTVLIGQQQLKQILADPSLEQLTQRVIAACHLKPISAEETRGYIECRLRAANWHGEPSFDGDALALIYRATGGNPRLINILADRLLLAGYLAERRDIDQALVESVLAEFNAEAGGVWNGRALLASDDVPVLAPLPEPGQTFAQTEVAAPVPEVDPPVAGDSRVAAEGKDDLELGQNDEVPRDALPHEVPDLPTPASTSVSDNDKVATSAPHRPSSELIDEDGFYHDDAPEFMPRPQKRFGRAVWSSIAGTLLVCAMGTYLILSEGFGNREHAFLAPQPPVVQTEDGGAVVDSLVTVDESAPEVDRGGEQVDEVSSAEPVSASDEVPLQKPPAPVVPAAPAEKAASQPNVKAVTEPKEVAKAQPKPAAGAEIPPVSKQVQQAPSKTTTPKPSVAESTRPEPSSAEPEAQQSVVDQEKAVKSSPKKDAGTIAISVYDASSLVQGFALAYEAGDLMYFPKMFTSDANADGTRGIVNIMRDYQELFQATTMRNMVLGEFEWKMRDNKAFGVGPFEVNVWEDTRNPPEVMKGMLELELVRASDSQRLLINNLSHKQR